MEGTLDREIKGELYKSRVLLGASSDLLGTVGSWGDSLPAADVLANLRGWNDATIKELQDRIGHFEIPSRRRGGTPAEVRKIV